MPGSAGVEYWPNTEQADAQMPRVFLDGYGAGRDEVPASERVMSGYRPGVHADITPQHYLKAHLFDACRNIPRRS
jgi:hypothetical protein